VRSKSGAALAWVSMHTNRRVRDIADHLVHTGELPGVPPRNPGLQEP
jgi:hypothetical protein